MRVPGRDPIRVDPATKPYTAGPDGAGRATELAPGVGAAGEGDGRRRRVRRRVVVVLLGAAVAVVAVIATGAFSGGNGNSNATALSKAVGTTTITRRDLVQDDSESGTLGFADTRTVTNRLAGTITWLPSAGSVIHQGQTLFAVDAKPVILLDGTVPAYRALSSSDSSGPDIGQLKRDLKTLGYDPSGAIGSGDAWDSGTTAAVKSFQQAHGLTQTGALDLGRVVFQPGPRRVDSLTVSVGSGAGSGGSGNPGASNADYRPGSARAVPAVYVAQSAPTGTSGPTGPPGSGPGNTGANHGHKNKNRNKPSSGRSPSATPAANRGSGNAGSNAGNGSGNSGNGSGGGGGASTPVMKTTATVQVVTVQLDTGKASVARVGERVSVQLPSGNYIHGTVTSVSRVATSSSSGGGGGGSGGSGATLPVTISVSASGQGLDKAPVTVLFEQSRARNVLAVPVTALIATPGGGFAVEVVDAAGHHQVPVTPGLYTSGYVQIDGAVQEGETVTNASG